VARSLERIDALLIVAYRPRASARVGRADRPGGSRRAGTIGGDDTILLICRGEARDGLEKRLAEMVKACSIVLAYGGSTSIAIPAGGVRRGNRDGVDGRGARSRPDDGRERALGSGPRAHVLDLREEFARDFSCRRCRPARYDGRHHWPLRWAGRFSPST
jgi:hypothetical protein